MADAKDPKLEMLKKFKDVSSWTKYFRRKQVANPAPQVSAIRSLDKTNNAAVKTLKDLLTRQQKRPITFIKNDFRREKTDRKQIQRRIESNSIAKETNRLMEDIRASLFNISNINEFDAKLNAIADSDLRDLLKLQQQLSIDQTKKNINGNAVKKIALTQERMYKVLEKIQDSLIVKQDIRSKKNNNININLVAGNSLGGSSDLTGAFGTSGQQDSGESFLTPYLEALLLLKNKGKVPTDLKNPSKWQKFLRSKYGRATKLAALLGALTYATNKFLSDPDKAISSLKNLLPGDVSAIRDLDTIDATKLFNNDGTFNGIWGLTNGLNLYSAIKNADKFSAIPKASPQDLAKALSKTVDIDYNLREKQLAEIKRTSVKRLFGKKYFTNYKIDTAGNVVKAPFYPESTMTAEQVSKLRKMPVLFKCLKSVGTVGTAFGTYFIASDIYSYLNVDIPAKIERAKTILKNDNIDQTTTAIIINNMSNASAWWKSEITKSITILAVSGISVGGGPVAVIAVSAISVFVDWLYSIIRDWIIGYKFNLADFDNPYTFIDQKELAKATSSSFIINRLNIDTLESDFKDSNVFRYAAANAKSPFNKQELGSKVSYTLDINNVKNKRVIGESYTQQSLYWSNIALLIRTFYSLTHYESWNTEVCGLTPKKYGDKITSDSSVSLFYPKKLSDYKSIFFCSAQTDVLNGQKILSDTIGTEILPLVYSIKFLHTIAVLYSTNTIKTLSDSLLNDIRILGITRQPIINELACLFGVSSKTGINYKDFKPFMISKLKSPTSLCQNNEYLSSYIKNAVLLYMVYLYINAENKSIKIQKADYIIDEEDIHFLVRVLRTESDWKIIKSTFDSKKDILVELFSKSSDVIKTNPANIKIGTSTSTEVESTKTEINENVIDNFVADNTIGDIDIVVLSDFSDIDKEDTNKYDNSKSGKLKLATKITQNMFKAKGVNVNATSASIIANAVLTYPTLFKDNKNDVYDVATGIKLNLDTFKNLEDINKNFPFLLASALLLESNKDVLLQLLKMTPEQAVHVGLERQKQIAFAHIEVSKGKKFEDQLEAIKKQNKSENVTLGVLNSFKNQQLISDYYKNISDQNFDYILDSGTSEPTEKTDQKTTEVPGNIGTIKQYDIQPGEVDVNAMLNSNLIDVKEGWVKSDNPDVQYFLNKESYGGKIEANKITDNNGNIIDKKKARGLFQFTPSTWNYITGGKDFDLAFDKNENFNAFKKLLMENAESLRARNIPLTRFNLYMAHQQGVGGIQNIHDIASGKLTEGKVFDDTMLNIKSNLKQSLKNKQESFTSQRLASEFLKSWEADAQGKVYVVQNIDQQNQTPKSEVSDVVAREEPGIAESLFIFSVTNDSIDGLINSIYYI